MTRPVNFALEGENPLYEILNSRRKSKKKDWFLISSFIYMGILLVSGIFGDMGVIKNYKLYKENKKIEEEIQKLEQENKKLRREADNLLGNPRYIEKIAREELNMSRDDEIIFIFPKDTSPTESKAKQ